MCSSRNRNTYGITTSSFSPPTNEAIPLRLALLNPWLAPGIGYRTADGYFSTACSEYLMSTMKSLVPFWTVGNNLTAGHIRMNMQKGG